MEKTGAGGPGQRSAGEGRRLIENGLNDLQRAVMVVVVSRVIGDSFDAFGGVAHGECVWTTPPISLKFLYSSRCVSKSEDGFRLPSTTFPSISTITMSSTVISAYSTPDGLIAMICFSRSISETLPQVNFTSPYSGSDRLASNTLFFNSVYVIGAPPIRPRRFRGLFLRSLFQTRDFSNR